MRRATIFFSLFAAILFVSSTAALAQRGRGSADNSGGGQSGPGMRSGGQQGPTMRGGGQGMERPSEMPSPQQRGRQGEPGGTPRGGDMPRGGPGEHPMGKGPQAGGEPQMGQKTTVGEQLERNEKLSSRLQGVLPEGTKLREAGNGFNNLGDFVAAAHVSHNLGIPFGDLKAKMAGGKNLGEAIHELRPEVDHNAAAKKAQEQARKDLQESRP
ncbi:MAG: hypothetical protein HY649_07850 [Acidobacteria bacterium]|nr:hypothetical protein [Acidobacteriota bacterium]